MSDSNSLATAPLSNDAVLLQILALSTTQSAANADNARSTRELLDCFNRIENRLEDHTNCLGRIENRLEEHTNRLDEMDNTLFNLGERFNTLNTTVQDIKRIEVRKLRSGNYKGSNPTDQ
ncbi:hypothetical protein F5B18DRAFT_356315 [Nemania serpens]|nr:hypothetical protein F5B18DRAFT_356315 [Nemania serpens]